MMGIIRKMVITIRICIIGLKKICLFLDIQEEEMDPELSLFSLLNTESRLNELIVRINNWVHQYHLVFDQPLAGTYWEEILSKSFADIGHKRRGHRITHTRLVRILKFRILLVRVFRVNLEFSSIIKHTI